MNIDNIIKTAIEDGQIDAEKDGTLLSLLSDTWNRYKQCQSLIAEKGLTYTNNQGVPIPLPEVKIETTCRKDLIAILQKLGLTPNGRKQLHIKSKASTDTLDLFLNANT